MSNNYEDELSESSCNEGEEGIDDIIDGLDELEMKTAFVTKLAMNYSSSPNSAQPGNCYIDVELDKLDHVLADEMEIELGRLKKNKYAHKMRKPYKLNNVVEVFPHEQEGIMLNIANRVYRKYLAKLMPQTISNVHGKILIDVINDIMYTDMSAVKIHDPIKVLCQTEDHRRHEYTNLKVDQGFRSIARSGDAPAWKHHESNYPRLGTRSTDKVDDRQRKRQRQEVESEITSTSSSHGHQQLRSDPNQIVVRAKTRPTSQLYVAQSPRHHSQRPSLL
jgi:hypothetical protein